MQKYIYWTLILCSALFSQININIDKKEVDFAKNIQEISNKSFVKYGMNIIDNNLTNGLQSLIEKKKDDNATKNTLFYFYSESMPLTAITNLLPKMKIFKELHPNYQIFVVFNGFPNKKFFFKLRKYYKDKYKKVFSIKIHPFIYKYYKLKEVPAWAYIKCGLGDDFRFKKCKRDDSILVRGDISLVDFFNILSTKYKKYNKDYRYLIKAK